MKRSVSVFTGALAALLLAGTSARAADIPWSFNWTPSTTKLISSGGPTNYLSISNEPGGTAAGNSNSVATNLRVFSDAPPITLGSPTFTGSTPVGFNLALTDTTSGVVHNFLYTIQFGGYINSHAAAVTANFVGPTSFTDVQIGGNLYTVNMPSYTPPGAPGSSNSGSVSVQISVRPVDVQKTPEPSTMALSCVGLSFLGLVGWRKRRQAALQLA
jgi:hypothetical protein